MDARVQELTQTRDTGITIFRAGIVSAVGVALMYLYLLMVASQTAAVLGGVLGLIIPVLCFVVGLGLYVHTVTKLRTYGVQSYGILRRQPRVPQSGTASSSAEADILRRLESQFEDE